MTPPFLNKNLLKSNTKKRKIMLTKKDRNHFKAIAKVLPPEASETLEKVKISGAEMLRLNPMAIDHKGKPIVRSQTYHVNQKKPVNHYKKLEEAYTRGGIDAVDIYCTEVRKRWEADQKVKEN